MRRREEGEVKNHLSSLRSSSKLGRPHQGGGRPLLLRERRCILSLFLERERRRVDPSTHELFLISNKLNGNLKYEPHHKIENPIDRIREKCTGSSH